MGGDFPRAYGCMDLLWNAAYTCNAVGMDGVLKGWSVTDIEACAMWGGEPGQFVEAAVKAGLLEIGDDVYVIHDFKEWAPDYVKRRWLRQNADLSGQRPDMTGQNSNVTGPHRVGKGREGKDILPVAANAAPAVSVVKSLKPKKQVERDALFDAIKAAFYPSGVSKADESLIGQTVTALKAKQALPEEVPRRIAQWSVLRPGASPLTPPGLAKHWDSLNGQAKPKGERPPKPTFIPGTDFENQPDSVKRAYEAWKNW